MVGHYRFQIRDSGFLYVGVEIETSWIMNSAAVDRETIAEDWKQLRKLC